MAGRWVAARGRARGRCRPPRCGNDLSGSPRRKATTESGRHAERAGGAGRSPDDVDDHARGRPLGDRASPARRRAAPRPPTWGPDLPVASVLQPSERHRRSPCPRVPRVPRVPALSAPGAARSLPVQRGPLRAPLRCEPAAAAAAALSPIPRVSWSPAATAIWTTSPGTSTSTPVCLATPSLRLEDSGSTGAITDLWVKCPKHDKKKNLGQAFGRAGRKHLPTCSGARPWLGDHDPKTCDRTPRVLLRGASNAYFSAVESALSIPPWSDPLQLALGQYADEMAKVDSAEKLAMWLEIVNAPELEHYTPEQLWQALKRRRDDASGEAMVDLRVEEWRHSRPSRARSIRRPSSSRSPSTFRKASSPSSSRVVLLERLREVRALRGFTRIDAIPDIGSLEDVEAVEAVLSPIFKTKTRSWYPGVDLRGEGIFLQLDEAAVQAWEATESVQHLQVLHEDAQRRWHADRGLEVTKLRGRTLHSAALALAPADPTARARLRVRIGLSARAHLQLVRPWRRDGGDPHLHGDPRLRGVTGRSRGDGPARGSRTLAAQGARGRRALCGRSALRRPEVPMLRTTTSTAPPATRAS